MSDASQDLSGFDATLAAVLSTPSLTLDSPQAMGLYAAAQTARRTGHIDLIDERIESARKDATDAILEVLALADLLENDRAFVEQSSSHVRVRRVVFNSLPVTVPELEMECFATPAGAVLVRTVRPGEREVGSIAAEIQLFVNRDLVGNDSGEGVPLDPSNLIGHLKFEYLQRLVTRILWGSGILLITDQRIIGLVFSRDVPQSRDSPERGRMPWADVLSSGGAVVVFDIDRSMLTSTETATGFMTGKLPPGSLYGEEVSIGFDSFAITDSGNKLVKPAKGLIAGIVREIAPS